MNHRTRRFAIIGICESLTESGPEDATKHYQNVMRQHDFPHVTAIQISGLTGDCLTQWLLEIGTPIEFLGNLSAMIIKTLQEQLLATYGEESKA